MIVIIIQEMPRGIIKGHGKSLALSLSLSFSVCLSPSSALIWLDRASMAPPA